jgi:hypothetical protein
MCVDFTSLNKACPKDDFPLPRISTLVDSAAGCEMLSLLDCFSGYHQIWMNREDEEKTSFITPSRTYCFRRMAEGLQNAGPTFARMTYVVFANDNSVSAYVDDIVVQSKLKLDHIADLRRTFAKLRTAKLKLNPAKCVFGVSKGKLLGCLVSARGIEANPAKIEAIRKMEPPTNKKLAKRLAGRMASLSRFISRSAERGLPFFEVLKSSEPFHWGPPQQKAFDDLKAYLTNLTTLAAPEPGEGLLLYVAASPHVVSAVLVKETQEAHQIKQVPLYFVSETLEGPKKHYTELEKVAYAVVMAARKLKHYFQAHEITMPSSFPLDNIFKNPEAVGRIAKWATELGDHAITFVGRTAIKSQALADFIADWTPNPYNQAAKLDPIWIAHTDGA